MVMNNFRDFAGEFIFVFPVLIIGEKFALLDKLPLQRRIMGSHLPAELVNVDRITKANAKVRCCNFYTFLETVGSFFFTPTLSG